MKKLFISISGLFAYPFLALPAFAQTNLDICGNTTGIGGILCGLSGTNAARTIQNIVVLFVVLAVVIALLYMVYGGIKWITSGGKKDEVEAARNHIVAAVVGLIVVFLAVFIVGIVLSIFGIPINSLQIPTIIPNVTPLPTLVPAS